MPKKLIKFSKLEEDIAKSIPIDNHVQSLLSGSSQIIKIEYGDSNIIPF